MVNGSTITRFAPLPYADSLMLAAMCFGRGLFEQGSPRSACRNQHEEAGYDEAAAEQAEQNISPRGPKTQRREEEKLSLPPCSSGPNGRHSLRGSGRDISPSSSFDDDDLEDAWTVGVLDADAGVACDAISRYADPLMRHNYLRGYKSAKLGLGTLHGLSDEQIEAELEDLREGMADEEHHRRGNW